MQWSVTLVYLLFRWRNSESWRSEEKYKTFCQDAPPPTMKRTTMFVTPDNKKQRWEWPFATLRAPDSALCSLISPSRSSVKLGFPTTRRTSICVTPDNKKRTTWRWTCETPRAPDSAFAPFSSPCLLFCWTCQSYRENNYHMLLWQQ